MKLLRLTLIGLACALPAICLAQWQWVDKDGRKVYSDQAPPAGTPAKNILRQPGVRGTPVSAEVPETAKVPASAPAAASAPKLSGKDKQLEDRKKQAEAAEAEKKKADEEQLARARADNCARARRAKTGIDSGVRIARTNDKGEREIMDDAARAAEAKRLEAVIAVDCQRAGG